MSRSVLDRIQQFNAGREPGALARKYALMAGDPFRFFRGSSHLFFEDLAAEWPFPEAPHTWNCGDLHLENFGSYRGGNGLFYFDINDFDEVVRAPLFIDLARLQVSLLIAGRALRLPEADCLRLYAILLDSYTSTLRQGKAWVVEAETASGLIGRQLRRVAERPERELIRERTTGKGRARRLALGPNAAPLPAEERNNLCAAFNAALCAGAYAHFDAVDAVFRIAGTGSIGVRRYQLLLRHRSEKEYRLVDLKEALPASLLHWRHEAQPAWTNEAERIAALQFLLQHVPQDLLAPLSCNGTWFVARALQPTADKITLAGAAQHPRWLAPYVYELGRLTASAQLRGSGRYGSATADELVAFSEGSDWQAPLQRWCLQYAAQVQQDFEQFRASVEVREPS